MITLYFHLQSQYKYELFHICFTESMGFETSEFEVNDLVTILQSLRIQLFQKMLSGRTTNVNCRTAIARLKRNVDIEY